MKSEDIAREYLDAFQNRDIISLGSFLSESVELSDWEQRAHGKSAVIDANAAIFSMFNKIELTITNIISSERQAAVEFDLRLLGPSDDISIPVTDIIEFDDDLKISSVRAYRGN